MEFPVYVAITTQNLEASTITDLAQRVQKDLDERNKSPVHRLKVVTAGHGTADKSPDILYTDPFSSSNVGNEVAATINLVFGETHTQPVVKVQPFSPVVDIYHPSVQLSQSSDLSALAGTVSSELLKLFAEEQVTLEYLLSGQTAHQDTPSVSDEYSKRSNRAFKYASTYHLTFSLFSGSASPSSWDIKAALDEYLAPFLESFSAISKFSVDTQVQLYASLSPSLHGPQYDETTKQWTLLRSDLSAFINAAEWPLSPSIGVGPTINFVAYAPSPQQVPLVIQETGGTSWLIPQWGGVQILNPTSSQDNTTVLTK